MLVGGCVVMVLCHFVKLGIVAYCILLYLCIVDGQTRRVPSGELKDHFPSDGCEQTTTTSGVEEEIHIRKKVVGTSIINDSRKNQWASVSASPQAPGENLNLSPCLPLRDCHKVLNSREPARRRNLLFPCPL